MMNLPFSRRITSWAEPPRSETSFVVGRGGAAARVAGFHPSTLLYQNQKKRLRTMSLPAMPGTARIVAVRFRLGFSWFSWLQLLGRPWSACGAAFLFFVAGALLPLVVLSLSLSPGGSSQPVDAGTYTGSPRRGLSASAELVSARHGSPGRVDHRSRRDDVAAPAVVDVSRAAQLLPGDTVPSARQSLSRRRARAPGWLLVFGQSGG